jgi:phosphatidylglycerophosphatase C
MRKEIAFFDFDGTISNKDSFIGFIRHSQGLLRFLVGILYLLPVIVGLFTRVIRNHKAKEIFLIHFFKGMHYDAFKMQCTSYSMRVLPSIVKSDALQKIQWHKNQNHRVVVVSASVRDWLEPFFSSLGVEVIATELELMNGKLSGHLKTKNCYGPEKVRRIREVIDTQEYTSIYAYGDTRGDKEMLELANFKFYKHFKK